MKGAFRNVAQEGSTYGGALLIFMELAETPSLGGLSVRVGFPRWVSSPLFL